jgi:hypothetical protein
MLTKTEPLCAQDHFKRNPRSGSLDRYKALDVTHVSDVLARVYALILSWPTSDEQTGAVAGGTPK